METEETIHLMLQSTRHIFLDLKGGVITSKVIVLKVRIILSL